MAQVNAPETTAHVLAVTLALLAIYPEEQNVAVQQVQNVLVGGRDPVGE